MIKGQLSTGFPSNKHLFSIEKAQRGSTSWNNLRTSSTCVYVPSGKHTNQPVQLFPLVEFSEEKRPKASLLRCYTQNMKELSANQISLLARQKRFLHSLTHLWNIISHCLMAKPLWSVVGKALIKIYLTLLFPCLLSALSWKQNRCKYKLFHNDLIRSQNHRTLVQH